MKMKITQITARAGRVVPHPTRSFANVRADLELTATIDESDDQDECVRKLQIQVERTVEEHIAEVQHAIREGEHVAQRLNRIQSLESELEMLREKNKGTKLLFSKFEDDE